MSSVIRLICPNLKCRKILTVPQSTKGKTVRCRNCGIRINVPGNAPSSPAPGGASSSTPTPSAGQ